MAKLLCDDCRHPFDLEKQTVRERLLRTDNRGPVCGARALSGSQSAKPLAATPPRAALLPAPGNDDYQEPLLSRDEFREQVFARDQHKCVICGAPAQDAHHIIERAVWDDGGYRVSNGASLCQEHHIAAEQTVLSCDDIRMAAGITHVMVPSHWYSDMPADKWLNPILPDGRRLKGERFWDENVQKILREGGVLNLFDSDAVSYPRSPHLPWSEGATKDDRLLGDTRHFEGREIVVTHKLDGEGDSLYRGYFHARSLDGRHHPSQDWIKNLHGRIQWDIPEGWRICGENVFARHTISYTGLPTYFFVFSIWNERNEALSWDDTKEWCTLLGLTMVPEIYRGPWNESLVRACYTGTCAWGEQEGYVVRVAEGFPYSRFRWSLAKFRTAKFAEDVNASVEPWFNKSVVPNRLAQR